MNDQEVQDALRFHREFQRAHAHMPMWVHSGCPVGYEPPVGPPVFEVLPPDMDAVWNRDEKKPEDEP